MFIIVICIIVIIICNHSTKQ